MSDQKPVITQQQIADNLKSIQKRIIKACEDHGRDPQDVRLLPVSKTKGNDVLRMAYAAGVREFGENKVQEARHKADELGDLEHAKWCVIGHLQTNKAKYVARFAHEFQALDSLRVAQKLNDRLELEDRKLDVFVQINSSNEPQKYGINPDQAEEFIQQLPQFKRLNIKGLMTLAIFSEDKDRVRECFVRMRQLRDKLRHVAPEDVSVEQLSMGMSGDFEIAIAEGANVVRVGQAIFGPRDKPDSYYWPS